MNREKIAHVSLRIGVAFAFLYPPFNALSDPNAWIGYFPVFVKGYVPDEVLLHAFGIVEVVIALWILSGWRIFWPSVAATAMLLGIVILNPTNFQVLFRDLAIAAIPFALAVISYGHERKSEPSGGIAAQS
ncbi:hypothetical protein COU18_03545 [Candidatus Kaiserbacteria bacterium CG10_big_fil_rev_8_21_14_0_10_51_14]|uniref:DoxX family protein n=1 Tax=Candidatus Kaiserbacteria bacterium CG10_big_fil_rev_8_21_14_0_10_51_14 TaxID=1974610 RepID=A0A2H0UBE6_9BACT|nr:MAG: hypothetical protein COU18_03545 [Candidatus Kaiserbacteria bacterium CG10_big_fil_rev_8_21_14_0_10_51_14]